MERPRRFFGLLCAHKWQEVRRATIRQRLFRPSEPERTVCEQETGVAVELRCEHCGDVKWRKVEL